MKSDGLAQTMGLFPRVDHEMHISPNADNNNLILVNSHGGSIYEDTIFKQSDL